MPKLRSMFNSIDVNGSGTIDKHELKKAISDSGRECTDAQVRGAMHTRCICRLALEWLHHYASLHMPTHLSPHTSTSTQSGTTLRLVPTYTLAPPPRPTLCQCTPTSHLHPPPPSSTILHLVPRAHSRSSHVHLFGYPALLSCTPRVTAHALASVAVPSDQRNGPHSGRGRRGQRRRRG